MVNYNFTIYMDNSLFKILQFLFNIYFHNMKICIGLYTGMQSYTLLCSTCQWKLNNCLFCMFRPCGMYLCNCEDMWHCVYLTVSCVSTIQQCRYSVNTTLNVSAKHCKHFLLVCLSSFPIVASCHEKVLNILCSQIY